MAYTKSLLVLLFCVTLSGCAFAPVETDPQKQMERWDAMRQECYKYGGVWNEEKHSCLGKDMRY